MKYVFAGMVLLAVLSFSRGGVINADFQPGPSGDEFSTLYSGQGAMADPGHDVWNAVSPPVEGYSSDWGSGGNFHFTPAFVSEPLADSEGIKTPVTVAVYRGTPLGTTFAVNPSNSWAYDHVANNAKALMSEYLIAPGGGTNEVVIEHLVPGAKYTLCLYGAGDQDTHQTTFAVAGVMKTTTGSPNAPHDLTAGGDYVIYNDVEAVAGAITISYTGAGKSRDGNFNGFQLRGEWPAGGQP